MRLPGREQFVLYGFVPYGIAFVALIAGRSLVSQEWIAAHGGRLFGPVMVFLFLYPFGVTVIRYVRGTTGTHLEEMRLIGLTYIMAPLMLILLGMVMY